MQPFLVKITLYFDKKNVKKAKNFKCPRAVFPFPVLFLSAFVPVCFESVE